MLGRRRDDGLITDLMTDDGDSVTAHTTRRRSVCGDGHTDGQMLCQTVDGQSVCGCDDGRDYEYDTRV